MAVTAGFSENSNAIGACEPELLKLESGFACSSSSSIILSPSSRNSGVRL